MRSDTSVNLVVFLEVKFMFRVVVYLVFIISLVVINPFFASAQERVRVGWAAMTCLAHAALGGAGKRIFSEAGSYGRVDLFRGRSTGNAGAGGR